MALNLMRVFSGLVFLVHFGCDALVQPPVLLDMTMQKPDVGGPMSMQDASTSNCPMNQMAVGEFCNGKDDDCDGLIDEGFSNCDDPVRCEDGSVRECSSECGLGEQTCQSGVWSACVLSSTNEEYCNNADDDCDGMVDEGDVCEMDQGIADAGVPDALIVDMAPSEQDMGLEPDMSMIPMPECRQHIDCENSQFCLRQNCISGLPGTYVFTLISVRFDPDEIGEPIGGGDPDVYAVLSLDGEEFARTEQVSAPSFVQWNERFEEEARRGDRFSICMYDSDILADDEIGCLEFTAADLVDFIRRYDGNRPANQPLWALVTPDPPRNVAFTELRFSIERLIRQ